MTKDQLIYLGLLIVIFISPTFTGLYGLGLVIYLITTNKLSIIFQKIKSGYYLVIFSLLSMIISIISKNINGLAISIGMLFLFLIILYYRCIVDKNLFYLIIKISTVMSFYNATIGIVQYFHILDKYNYVFLEIGEKANQRITSSFSNANFYATMIEFVILIAVYKLLVDRERQSSKIYYFVVIVVNIFMLYLTGCRTAWIGIVIAVPMMFIFKKKYKVGIILLAVEIVTIVYSLGFMIFPRVDTITHDFGIRFSMWKIAAEQFIKQPLFGLGPHGYEIISSGFRKSIRAVHAHSMYFDALISFGIVPLLFFGMYVLDYIKLYTKSSHKNEYSFIIGILAAIAFHGIFDFTILDIQVGLFFFILISSIGIREFEL